MKRRTLILVLAFATAIKLSLALFTQGSFDLLLYKGHLLKIQELGVGAYRAEGFYFNPFNHPPLMIHLLRFWGWLSQFGLAFGFWLRLPSVLADVGSVFLVWHWLGELKRENPWVLLALVLCPASILISGFHGNTDSLMIFLLLLSIYLVEKESRWAGVVFGLSVGIKVMPLIFAPAIFFHLPLRKRFEFFGLAGGIFLICSLPYVVQDPSGVWSAVFGYTSVYGGWGWTLLAHLFFPQPPTYVHSHGDVHYGVQGAHAVFAQILKWLTIALAIAVPFWLRRESLFVQCGFITAIVLFFAPGFGYQYLVWLVPFVTVLGLRETLAYYATTAIYLFTVYVCYAERFCPNPLYLTLMSLACWLSILFVLVIWIRHERQSLKANAQRPLPHSGTVQRDSPLLRN
jgi:hypothetical protein